MNIMRFLVVAAIGVALFIALAPVAYPPQFGVDICPNASIAVTYVSMTYLYFRFGGVYSVGFGYHIYLTSFC